MRRGKCTKVHLRRQVSCVDEKDEVVRITYNAVLVPHLLIGIRGEDTACDYLRRLGYEIRGRNVCIVRDEIDIIARDPTDDVLVFAEVKSRVEFQHDYPPELRADWKKLRKLRRSARRWVANNDYDGGYRLDLICIADGKVTAHFKELMW